MKLTVLLRNSGFSITGLISVIAIIGILSAVAVPSYQKYVIKSKLSDAIVVLNSITQQGITEYLETDTIPTKIFYGDFVLSPGNMQAYSAQYVNGIHYGYNASTNQMWFCVQVVDLGIPEQQASDGTSWGIYSAICTRTQETSYQKIEVACGRLNDTDAKSIPLDYLPSGCSCKSTTDFDC